VPSLFGRVMYCRRESRFVQNLDVRRQTGGPRGVTHQGNANANKRVFTVLILERYCIFDVSGSGHNFKGITSAVYMLCDNFTGNIRGSIHQRTVLRLHLRFRL
jgi:hypothetical protein